MLSERKQAMMRSVASRATIANFLQEGYVLDNNAVLDIRASFGLSTQNAALWDLRLEIDGNEVVGLKLPRDVGGGGIFEIKTGVPARRSLDWTPVVYWDARRYASLEEAQNAYFNNFQQMREALGSVLYPER